MAFSEGFVPLDIRPGMRLQQVVRKIANLPFEGTDCAVPLEWARRNARSFGGFVIYTDSETWAGAIHPAQALRNYRNQVRADARSVVVGMTSTGFTIADPADRGMLDVVGFDAAAPAFIADFIRGESRSEAGGAAAGADG
jgi:60 kDa SS-A/Ro ribonucleoprotein